MSGCSDTVPQTVTVRGCFADPILDVMNFLNEVVDDFPSAISFAPGRPLESLFRVEEHLASVHSFTAEMARRSGHSRERVWRDLGQYCRTNGLIGDLIATHLARDEGIHVPADAVIVTVGAQEAMAVVMAGLFEPGQDILLVSDPTYIGITGLARMFGVQVVPVPSGEHGLDAATVERAIVSASRQGRVRALYDIPDFNNPLGTTLPLRERFALLEVCRRHHVLIIEDNPYGMFAYDGDRLPTLKALDRDGNVLYIGSFAKTLFPGLRVGYLVSDARVEPHGETLAKTLSRVKSLITVNTPPLLQALVGGVLIETGGVLEPIVAPKRAQYRRNRDAMDEALREHCAPLGVTWNMPAGGFFLSVTLPFEFGPDELRRCAREYGVIVCPMRFFCLDSVRRTQVRLSFSYVEPDTIATGVARLARFVADELEAPARAHAAVRAIAH